MDRLSVIGLGRMGRPICARLVESGFEVTTTNLVSTREADVETAGARWGEELEP